LVDLAHQGLGITVFGIAYMFVHDGLVHKRFPVGPIADVPYFRKVAAAHKVNIKICHQSLFF
jgi:beta-carotene 3-hydroxylase